MKKIAIVYFVYINDKKNYQKLIKGQLSDIARSGVFNDADLYIQVSMKTEHKEKVKTFFESLPYEIKEIEYHFENKFEYYGIHKLYTIAKSGDYPYLVYLHTKGMSYNPHSIFNPERIRSFREIILTYYTFRKYKKTIELFEKDSDIQKIGFMPNKEDGKEENKGLIMWFNFFWVRSSFVCSLNEPVQSDDRFYFERWIARPDKDRKDEYLYTSYSLYADKKEGFTQAEASDTLKYLKKLYKYTRPISTLYRLLTVR
ncbi:MAG: hypothetical protein II291_03575 [Succinivibrio sp.]|nr:hypothetical protein [Succinivibrio sp.]